MCLPLDSSNSCMKWGRVSIVICKRAVRSRRPNNFVQTFIDDNACKLVIKTEVSTVTDGLAYEKKIDCINRMTTRHLRQLRILSSQLIADRVEELVISQVIVLRHRCNEGKAHSSCRAALDTCIGGGLSVLGTGEHDDICRTSLGLLVSIANILSGDDLG